MTKKKEQSRKSNKKQQSRKSNKKQQQQTPFDKVSRLVKKVQQKASKKTGFPFMKLTGIIILLTLIIMISVLIYRNNSKINQDYDE